LIRNDVKKMRRFLWVIFSMFSIFIGVSFLLFVIRMIWFPPTAMGMMMGRETMFHHMFFWMRGMFWVFLIFIILLVLNLIFTNKKNNR